MQLYRLGICYKTVVLMGLGKMGGHSNGVH